MANDTTQYHRLLPLLQIKYFNPELKEVKPIENGDWYDLRAAEDVEMKAGEYRLISLGVAMKLPPDGEALVVPRSSTFKNFGIIQANSVGVIDHSYCGDDDMWYFPAIALRDTQIHLNDRICQFRVIERQPELEIKKVDHLEDKNRGGFGSTGRN